MVRHLIVIEGPAGSGKSTLAKKLKDTNIAYSSESYLEKPRAYPDGPRGAMLSQMIDLSLIVGSFFFDDKKPVVLDRLGVSRWCYESLDRGQKIAEYSTGYEIVSLLQQQIPLLYREFKARCGETNPNMEIPKFQLDYIFLSPSYMQLKENREKAKREFKYDLIDELRIFNDAYLALSVLYPRVWGINLALNNERDEASLQAYNIIKAITSGK